MPNYLYRAKKGPTEIVEGQILAESEDAALSKLSVMGLLPIKLVAEGAAPAVAKAPRKTESPQQKSIREEKDKPAKEVTLKKVDKARARISPRDLNIFTRQFAILLKASVPLLRAFEVLQQQTQDMKFRDVLKNIQDDLREGASLSDVLGRYPKIFSTVYVSMIQSGEVSGTLDKVLGRLADFAEQDAEVRSKVKSAMVYPLFLLMVGVGTVFVLLTFVMPRLMVVFGDLGTDLPAMTQGVIAVSEFCQAYWMYMLGATGAMIVWLRSRGLSEGQWKALDAIFVNLPVFGNLIEKSDVSKFLRSLELLYDNGIPLFQAVAIAMRTISNRTIRASFSEVAMHLEGGETLAKSLSRVKYISPFVTNMVSVGEESGQLTMAVGETASFFEAETNQFIKITTSLVEPFMILSIGLVIGFIVIAMLLPIFEISALAS